MLTHSLIQYLTLPATPPPPVALAAGVRFIHKARLYEREIKDSLTVFVSTVLIFSSITNSRHSVVSGLARLMQEQIFRLLLHRPVR